MSSPTDAVMELSDVELGAVELWAQGRHASYRDTLHLIASLRATRARLEAAEALAEIVLSLDDAGRGADCGAYMHGMSGDAVNGGCSYCERLEAWRALAHPEAAGKGAGEREP